MNTTGSDEKGATAQTDWAAATSRVRDVADWIIKAFVALAAVLIGSGPILVNFADLHADWRGLFAILSGITALFAVGVIIWLATDIKLTQVTDITDLTEPKGQAKELLNRLKRSKDARRLYFLGARDVAGILEAREAEIYALEGQIAAQARAKNAATLAELKNYEQTSRATIAALDAVLRNLEGWATYETVRGRFQSRRPWMFIGAFVVAIAVACWVGALNIKLGAKADAASSPSVGSVTAAGGKIGTLAWLTAPQQASAVSSVRTQLGMTAVTCDIVGVVVEGGTGDLLDPWQVLVLPNDPCPSKLRFAVDRRLATVNSIQASDTRKAEITINSTSQLGLLGVVTVWLLSSFAAFALGWLAHRRLGSDR